MEQAAPMWKRMEDKLDKVLENLQEKASKGSVAEAHEEIDKLQLALGTKADRTEVEAVRGELKQVRDKVLIWTGGGAVLVVLVAWYGPKLFALLAK